MKASICQARVGEVTVPVSNRTPWPPLDFFSSSTTAMVLVKSIPVVDFAGEIDDLRAVRVVKIQDVCLGDGVG